ncbi:MAG: hypothetical protein ACYC6W_10845 [Nitrosotalea sp.]
MKSAPNPAVTRILSEDQSVNEQAQGYRPDFFKPVGVVMQTVNIQMTSTTINIVPSEEKKKGLKRYEYSEATVGKEEEKPKSCWDRICGR